MMENFGASPLVGDSSRIGFIGLGKMGAPMARRLVDAGYNLVVQDVSVEATSALSADRVTIAQSPADVAAQADIIFMSLPTPEIVMAVCSGPEGILQGEATRIVVDLSTTGPRATKRIAQMLSQRDIALIDAPVSGGVAAAQSGKLAIMASGDKATFVSVESLFDILGSKVFYVGDAPGMGQAMKLVNNMLAASNAIAAFEVLTLGAKLGLDGQLMLDVLNVSSGQSFMTTTRIPQTVLPRNFPTRFAADLMYKDVRLCAEEAEAAGAQLWVGQTVKQVLAFAVAQGGGDKDFATIIQHYEKWADTIVGSKPEN